MNPFVALNADSKPTAWGWLAARPGLIAFVLTLALGFAAVGWRVNSRAKAARQFARLEAQARGASVQGQIRHAVAALQVLGALARQSGGSIPDFQTVGADLRAAWPDLATLELEPNGIAGDIVPRAGYERFIGFNVLKDPAQFPSAQAAIQRRAATVAGPLKLYRGEPGIVVRAPVFLRGRDGREVFWGFVAASLRLTEPLARVRTDELQQAVQQEFGAQALKSSPTPVQLGGWLQKSKTPLEGLGVLFMAVLLWLLMHLVQSGHTLEAALADANRRLASLGAERGQAQADWRSAKEAAASAQNQLKQARAALQRAESGSLECQARLEESERANRETTQALDARLKQAELNAQELQAQLEAAVRAADAAARAAEAELEEARGALHQPHETVGQLQSHPATQAENDALAPAAPAQDPPAGQGQLMKGAGTASSPLPLPTGCQGSPDSESGSPPLALRLHELPLPAGIDSESRLDAALNALERTAETSPPVVGLPLA
ncbi:MAG TPA: CHASE domain-containing protein, partial [Dongiaceae bacterium]|nr:CHASE domain-containing protein [Dongiaceae bacterium]